jgi:Na+/H+ antiporter NhaC
MMYIAFPLLIAAMFGYMFFHAGFSMRRQRILSKRAERRRRWVPARLRSRQVG